MNYFYGDAEWLGSCNHFDMTTKSSTFTTLREIISQFIPQLFICPGCEMASAKGICESCTQSIRRNSGILSSTIASIQGIAPLFFSFETSHRLLKRWKEGDGSLLNNLVFNIEPGLREELRMLEFDFIVPIPQSEQRSWKRGHESALSVARYFARELDCPVISLLELKKHLPRQASLDQWARDHAENPFQIDFEMLQRMRPAFKLGKPGKILIVDDLITSGNTLLRASEVLNELLPQALLWAGSMGYRPPKVLSMPVIK